MDFFGTGKTLLKIAMLPGDDLQATSAPVNQTAVHRSQPRASGKQRQWYDITTPDETS
jgi:hypothetical protein